MYRMMGRGPPSSESARPPAEQAQLVCSRSTGGCMQNGTHLPDWGLSVLLGTFRIWKPSTTHAVVSVPGWTATSSAASVAVMSMHSSGMSTCTPCGGGTADASRTACFATTAARQLHGSMAHVAVRSSLSAQCSQCDRFAACDLCALSSRSPRSRRSRPCHGRG